MPVRRPQTRAVCAGRADSDRAAATSEPLHLSGRGCRFSSLHFRAGPMGRGLRGGPAPSPAAARRRRPPAPSLPRGTGARRGPGQRQPGVPSRPLPISSSLKAGSRRGRSRSTGLYQVFLLLSASGVLVLPLSLPPLCHCHEKMLRGVSGEAALPPAAGSPRSASSGVW